MKIRIDIDRCQGHGVCYTVAPELFTDDDRGYGVVRGDGVVSQEHEAAAERAGQRCPERAIVIEP